MKLCIEKIPNYAYISQPYFEKVKSDIDNFLKNVNDNFPDQTDPDLTKFTVGAKRMITELDNMQQALRDAKLIK